MTPFERRAVPIAAGVMLLIVGAWWVVNLVTWWGPLTEATPVYLEPQGGIRTFLATEWVESGQPRYVLPEYDTLPPDVRLALLPRDASITDGAIVPKDFAYPVAVAAVAELSGGWMLPVIPQVFALVAAGLVALIAFELTRDRLAAVAAFTIAGTSVIWWSATYGGLSLSLMGVSAGLGAAIIMLRYSTERVPGLGPLGHPYFVAGILTGIAVGFHYGSFTWWGAILATGAIGEQRSVSVIARRLFFAVLGGLVALLPVAAFNVWLYGSPTATGYSEFATVLDAVGFEAGWIGFSAEALLGNMGVYLTRPEILPLLLLGAFGRRLMDVSGRRLRPVHLGIVATGFLLMVAITGSSELWGTGRFLTNASILRYLAPVMSFVIVAAAVGLSSITRNPSIITRLAGFSVIAFLVTVNLVAAVGQENGLIETRALLSESNDQQEAILSEVPSDGIVVTRRLDKAIFPHRSVLVATYLATVTASPDARHLYDTLPSTDRLVTAVAAFESRPFYIMNDTRWLSRTDLLRLDRDLGKLGRCIVATSVDDLYAVDDCNSSL